MIRLIEFCIKGDLYFFENSFSEEKKKKIENKAHIYFQSENASVTEFIKELYKELSLKIRLAKIEKVIAV